MSERVLASEAADPPTKFIVLAKWRLYSACLKAPCLTTVLVDMLSFARYALGVGCKHYFPEPVHIHLFSYKAVGLFFRSVAELAVRPPVGNWECVYGDFAL